MGKLFSIIGLSLVGVTVGVVAEEPIKRFYEKVKNRFNPPPPPAPATP